VAQNPSPEGSQLSSPRFISGISIHGSTKTAIHRSSGYRSPNQPEPKMTDVPEAGTTVQEKYARILGVNEEEISNLFLYQFIENWWGTPYRLGGNGKNGIDCSAFVQVLLSTVFGIGTVPRTAAAQYSDCTRVKVQDLQEGDLVFFSSSGRSGRNRRRHATGIVHVGIFLRNDKFVHASSSEGVTISDLNDSYWEKRYAGAGRWNGLARN
jgi:hypothetical protein